MSDERRDGFGLPFDPPDAETAVVQYLNRSMHKLHVSEYHRREFERLEDQRCRSDPDGGIDRNHVGFEQAECPPY
ncbi:MAG: hypothetical protein ACREA0_11820 [bacterium]